MLGLLTYDMTRDLTIKLVGKNNDCDVQKIDLLYLQENIR